MLKEKTVEYHDIYIVFLSTNTTMGRMIRFFTRNQYSHVTVAFEKDLRLMYSFARYHINSPFFGGFVTEQPLRYLYGNKDVLIKLCKLTVDEKEYERIQQEIAYFCTNREHMIYNTPNAVLSLLGKRMKVENMFTCLEFVTHLLRYPDMLSIKELENCLKQQIIYQGSLKGIASMEFSDSKDDFFARRDAAGVVVDTVYHIKRVAGRVISV